MTHKISKNDIASNDNAKMSEEKWRSKDVTARRTQNKQSLWYNFDNNNVDNLKHSHQHRSAVTTNPISTLKNGQRSLNGESSAAQSDEIMQDKSCVAERKFTIKKSPHKKDAFGSSSTLSSTTELSEDGDSNFHVVLRVRPLSAQEKQRRDQFVVRFPGEGLCSVKSNGSERHFQFDVVFEPDAAQDDVFENCGIKRLVDSAVLGYTCTAFAFGQTGSGKTYTVTGSPAHFQQLGIMPDPTMYGIIQRSFKYMYRQLNVQGSPKVIRASYLEIYNEQVIDLLNNSHRRYLSVRWSKHKGFYVENLFSVECEQLDDLMAVLEEGLRSRQTGSQGLNEFSSRSHSVLTVTIDSETQADVDDENLFVTKRGKLSFVDLAGSEKVKNSNVAFEGTGMHELSSINKSLLVLGNCISHLGNGKRRQGYIPYRDSKLTKLLSDSLGGSGITLMIACITPSSTNITETMNTLRYASRAKKIRTRPTVKMDPREKLIVNLKREIKILRNENHYLRNQLQFPAKPKGELRKENDEDFLKFMESQKDKENGQYEMLQEYMVENENLRTENSEMHSLRDRTGREQQLLYKENEKLTKRVEDLERVMEHNPVIWANRPGQPRTDGYGQYDLSPHQSPGTKSISNDGKQRNQPTSRDKSNIPGPVKPPHRLSEPVMKFPFRPSELHLETDRRMTETNTDELKSTRKTKRTNGIHSINEQLRNEVQQLEGQTQRHSHQTPT